MAFSGPAFEILAESTGSRARAGLFHTAHGPIRTPAFMPVGTNAAVRGLTPSELESLGADCVLANTYHLWLRPGEELIQRAGGLHAFMRWNGPMLTDSGGFQILSLRHFCHVEEAGATFRSHLDETERLLTPEAAMDVQAALGSDIAMALDICPPYDCGLVEVERSTQRTLRWAERSLAARHAPGQAVFGIAQGGTGLALRAEAAAALARLPFDGFAIGGLSVGERRTETWPALDASIDNLPADRPRYLMGVGAPEDLFEGIRRGVDLFDCVLPTRLGRTGVVFTSHGPLDLRRPAARLTDEPIEECCDCPTCQRFSVGYLHHLFRGGEELGMRLASLHNVRFLVRLVCNAREAILGAEFDSELLPSSLRREDEEEGAGRPRQVSAVAAT